MFPSCHVALRTVRVFRSVLGRDPGPSPMPDESTSSHSVSFRHARARVYVYYIHDVTACGNVR
jgi:hypothetical protein